MPDVDFPVVAVVTSYPGASPEAVESDIVEPIEDVISTLAGIDRVESTARTGSALVLIIFDLEDAFLFPWAVTLMKLPPEAAQFAFWSMMTFLGILVVGFIYEWKKGALEWE